MDKFYFKSSFLEDLKHRLAHIKSISLQAEANCLAQNPQAVFLANQTSLVSFNFAFKRNDPTGKQKLVQVNSIPTGNFKNFHYFPEMNCDLTHLFILQQQILEGIVDIYLQIFNEISDYFETSVVPDQGNSNYYSIPL